MPAACGSEDSLSRLGKFEDAIQRDGFGQQGADFWKRPSEVWRSDSEPHF